MLLFAEMLLVSMLIFACVVCCVLGIVCVIWTVLSQSCVHLFNILCCAVLLVFPSRTQTIFALDLLFTIIFTLEAICKILCLGLVSDFSQPVRSSYLSDGWNVLDLCLIVLAYVDIGMDHTQAVGMFVYAMCVYLPHTHIARTISSHSLSELKPYQ